MSFKAPDQVEDNAAATALTASLSSYDGEALLQPSWGDYSSGEITRTRGEAALPGEQSNKIYGGGVAFCRRREVERAAVWGYEGIMWACVWLSGAWTLVCAAAAAGEVVEDFI